MFGYNNAVIGGVMVLPAFERDFALPPTGTFKYTTITANIVSLLQVGAIVGSLMVFPILKYLGRRTALGISGVVFFAGATMQASLTSPSLRNSVLVPCSMI